MVSLAMDYSTRIRIHMPITTRRLLAALTMTALVGCDKTLTVEPSTEVEVSEAIIDAGSARAALAGAYDALQSGSYYGGSYLFFGDLPTDNAEHVGTFTTYADVDLYVTTADNSTIEGIWDKIYDGIGRANTLIALLPNVKGLSDADKNDMLGQAYLLRALHYHNLVKFWGPVPIRLAPPPNLDELASTTRAPVTEVYTRILADLDKAAQLMSTEARTRKGSRGAVDALRSRVLLYKQDYVGTEAAANAAIARGYRLTAAFPDLFDAVGNNTPEDIWRASFTATEYNLLGYYYISKEFGGRRELAPTANLASAFEAADQRGTWSVKRDSRNRRYGGKFPTTEGAEDLHVIRLGEVLLNKAEAQARQGKLAEAVATYNLLRVRAGVAPHALGVTVTTQQQVIDAVLLERRRELAFEGDRWPDLVRTNRAVALLGIPAFRTLFPIPQNEIDVAPAIVQNTGY
jgi:starch-binding outer membrane protein, SusD/RagB family